ncbi:hypothetical protein SENTW_3509 [Salmonella enterica subsp. enterica serovar Weltevreden str. 2007-60-3289-1]|uniref:Uncharacterized protein n=2 Tax=Salmonella enterica I TaxID=59201 RepID=A0A0F6B7H3_SALT1|nr:hypothetical protein SPAB_04209 [Salmonella enterica subsp. enterica serovar Paratyphi B str. SPB7]ACY90471.1 hypothetical protein STM14_4075 [Salmonella enterica subsp. enterica serovar Typhimurium str. 14028S]CBY97590.1 hypothetical protein SENTW_3509 [Salmonella enterica subsp. enterica serovar Weltevreden str. 2007-60-3289-1]
MLRHNRQIKDARYFTRGSHSHALQTALKRLSQSH